MLVVTNEGMQWAQNYCKEIKEKYPLMQEHKTPEGIKVMEFTCAYQTGAQFIQNKLANVKGMLQEKANKEEMVFTKTKTDLKKVKRRKRMKKPFK